MDALWYALSDQLRPSRAAASARIFAFVVRRARARRDAARRIQCALRRRAAVVARRARAAERACCAKCVDAAGWLSYRTSGGAAAAPVKKKRSKRAADDDENGSSVASSSRGGAKGQHGAKGGGGSGWRRRWFETCGSELVMWRDSRKASERASAAGSPTRTCAARAVSDNESRVSSSRRSGHLFDRPRFGTRVRSAR